MGLIKEAFSTARDRASSALLRQLADTYMRKYGRVEGIVIDSSRKAIDAKVLLYGETESITLSISRYEIILLDGHHRVIAHGVSASREWVGILARECIEGRPIRIPSSLARALSLLA